MLLIDVAMLALAVAVLAGMMRTIDSWRKEALLHRRLAKLQQLVIALERERGNGVDLDIVPKVVADSIRARLPQDGVIVVLSAQQDLEPEVQERIQVEATHGPVCLLIEGSDLEVGAYTNRHGLQGLMPVAVSMGTGGGLVRGVATPFLIEVRNGLVIRRALFGAPGSTRSASRKDRGETSSRLTTAELLEATRR